MKPDYGWREEIHSNHIRRSGTRSQDNFTAVWGDVPKSRTSEAEPRCGPLAAGRRLQVISPEILILCGIFSSQEQSVVLHAEGSGGPLELGQVGRGCGAPGR